MSIDRKAALLGRATGEWVNTRGMRGLRLNAKVRAGTRVKVEQILNQHGSKYMAEFTESGRHQLYDALWTRVEVSGDCDGALCLLETTTKEVA